jgi:hypothetical protein
LPTAFGLAEGCPAASRGLSDPFPGSRIHRSSLSRGRGRYGDLSWPTGLLANGCDLLFDFGFPLFTSAKCRTLSSINGCRGMVVIFAVTVALAWPGTGGPSGSPTCEAVK